MSTKIAWTDETWNPTVGCARVSPGCVNCYAEHAAAMVNRTQGERSAYRAVLKVIDGDPRWNGSAQFLPERLSIPIAWRTARRVFVDSMSDLFHDDITNEQIAAVFGLMAATPRHTYQVLTKRPARMLAWFRWAAQRGEDGRSMFPHDEPSWRIGQMLACYLGRHGINGYVGGTAANGYNDFDPRRQPWPLPNVWLGVSTEDQVHADDRVPQLLDTPAAVRFISAEPLLGSLLLWAFLKSPDRDRSLRILDRKPEGAPVAPGLDWVIVGAESGPGARRCSGEWVRSIRDECAAAGVAFFLKQAKVSVGIAAGEGSHRSRGVIESPYLDGVQHAAFPVGA